MDPVNNYFSKRNVYYEIKLEVAKSKFVRETMTFIVMLNCIIYFETANPYQRGLYSCFKNNITNINYLLTYLE